MIELKGFCVPSFNATAEIFSIAQNECGEHIKNKVDRRSNEWMNEQNFKMN